jgi:uncharacterized protein with FMN-binding domain
MKKIVVAVMSTISGLLLLFSYHTSTNSQAASTTTGGSGTDPQASGATTPNAGSGSSGTYTGDAAQTRWGTVQVQIVVADGKIVSSDAIQYPSGNSRDQQINAYAVPQLNAEVVAAQSGSIDAVSGATVTSDGYITSLQSAIDQAHL